MLLVCSKCSAKYSIADSLIGEELAVKCSSCGHIWYPLNKSYKTNNVFLKDKLSAVINLKILCKSLILVGLTFIAISLSLIFFWERLIIYPFFANYYAKFGVYPVQGLLLQDIQTDLTDHKMIITAKIHNSSADARHAPIIRYSCKDSGEQTLFRYFVNYQNNIIESGKDFAISFTITNINPKSAMIQIDLGNKINFLIRK